MSQGWVLIFVAVSLVGTGCADKQGWSSLPVSISADPALMATPEAAADFQDAMAFWEAKVGKQVFDYQGAWTGQMPPYSGSPTSPGTILGNVIFSQSPWTFASDIAGQTDVTSSKDGIQVAMIMINPNTAFCSGDCTGQEKLTSRRRAFAHELGHFLGLQHVSDTANIMYPVIQPGGTLSGLAVDDVALKNLIN